MRLTRTWLLDVATAAGLIYVGIWMYELANLAVLSALGGVASLEFSGLAPIGVTATVSNTSLLLWTKPAQICLATLGMLALFLAVRSMRLRISSNIALTTIGIYLASAYWEFLSSLGNVSYEVHLAIFCTLAVGAQVALSSRFKIQVASRK